MATLDMPTRPILRLALLAGLVAVPAARLLPGSAPTDHRRADRGPSQPTGLDAAPPEVRAFLAHVLEQLPEGGAGVAGYRFRHWEQQGQPTRAALGIKAIPGVDPQELIARVMDVDGYEGRIAHVEACLARPDPAYVPPAAVRFYQRIAVPGVARVQQEAVLVDAGMLKGYRVAYWYLLRPETQALDPRDGPRSESSVGAWLAGPGVVGYALSCWPCREDVNAVQWLSLTVGADALAARAVEGTIDGMAAWSRQPGESVRGQSAPTTRSTSTVRLPRRRTIATNALLDQTPSSASPSSADVPMGPESAPVATIGRHGSMYSTSGNGAGTAGGPPRQEEGIGVIPVVESEVGAVRADHRLRPRHRDGAARGEGPRRWCGASCRSGRAVAAADGPRAGTGSPPRRGS